MTTRRRKRYGITSAEWNERYPVGTPVRFQPVKGIDVFEETKTRSEAWDICDTPCVMIEGRSGGCAIDHMTVLGSPDSERGRDG